MNSEFSGGKTGALMDAERVLFLKPFTEPQTDSGAIKRQTKTEQKRKERNKLLKVKNIQ